MFRPIAARRTIRLGQSAALAIGVGVLLSACAPVVPGWRELLPGSNAIATADESSEPQTTAPAAPVPTTSVPAIPGSPATPLPPDALISVEGGDPVAGALGSFTWRESGSDSPWLPGAPIHVGQGEQLVVSLAGPIAIANWTAARTRPGSLDGSTAIGLGEGRGDLPQFRAPPPGSWSVQVVVWFAANQGSAAYYWLVEVD